MRGSLVHYRKKRHFEKTPEPSGRKRKSSKELLFVIQKHHARRLHYDLRLEMGGVLKSWAIPKGPPKKIGEKHLAVLTEDHPLTNLTEIVNGRVGEYDVKPSAAGAR